MSTKPISTHTSPRRQLKNLLQLACSLLLMLLLSSGWAQTAPADNAAANDGDDEAPEWLLSDLASAVDLVALVQVEQTQYKYRRGFPIEGYADLRLLIPYKLDAKTDLVRVRESGLRDDGCYFPQTFLGDEGARFLVFLAAAANAEDGIPEYLPHPMSCKQSVLVNAEHDYVLRYPLEGNVRLSDEQRSWLEKFDFSDPAAFAGEPDLTPGRKQKLAEQVDGLVDERGVKYTRGVHIRHFRELIGKENLQRPRGGGKY